MMKLRRSEERGKANHGWLNAYHTFSFGDYFDPDYKGFQALRVINEDLVEPNNGFGTHPHNNMEILTYVLSGELSHKDSMGNGSVIKAGEFQFMSAGTGVTHSEFNPSSSEKVHLLQIWIIPNKKNIPPTYSEWKPTNENLQDLTLIASIDGREGSIKINQDVSLYLGRVNSGKEITQKISSERHAWLQLIEGELQISNLKLLKGDGLAVSGEELLQIKSLTDSRFLLFDLV